MHKNDWQFLKLQNLKLQNYKLQPLQHKTDHKTTSFGVLSTWKNNFTQFFIEYKKNKSLLYF